MGSYIEFGIITQLSAVLRVKLSPLNFTSTPGFDFKPHRWNFRGYHLEIKPGWNILIGKGRALVNLENNSALLDCQRVASYTTDMACFSQTPRALKDQCDMWVTRTTILLPWKPAWHHKPVAVAARFFYWSSWNKPPNSNQINITQIWVNLGWVGSFFSCGLVLKGIIQLSPLRRLFNVATH